MVGLRGLWGIAIVLAASGCASPRATSRASVDGWLDAAARSETPESAAPRAPTRAPASRLPDSHASEPADAIPSDRPPTATSLATTTPRQSVGVRFAPPQIEIPAPSPRGGGATRLGRAASLAPLAALEPAIDAWSLASLLPASSGSEVEFADGAVAMMRVGKLFAVEICTASEPLETDTPGYWDEFHLGRAQDQRIDVSWLWQRGPSAALVGCVGMPRNLNRDLGSSILDPEDVFVAMGVKFCW